MRASASTVTPSQANFVWLEAAGIDGAELARRLDRAGVRVAGGGSLGDPKRIRVVDPRRRGDRPLPAALDGALSEYAAGMGLDPTDRRSAPGAAAASCTSARRSTTSASLALLRPASGIDTVLTADAYGQGEADRLLGRALEGVAARRLQPRRRRRPRLLRRRAPGRQGLPALHRSRGCAAPDDYAGYLRMAAERTLERIGADAFDLLLLHNPDRTGYTTQAVWDGMAALRDAGLTRLIGVAPGPANGFTLDVIDCLERFGDRIDWAMVILNPLEPWPGELVPRRRRAATTSR